MAVATKYYGTTFEVASLDTNWSLDLETHIIPAAKKGARIVSIWFVPSGADDVCIIRDGSATGPVMFHGKSLTASDNDITHWYDGALKTPYVQQSDCNFTASANARIIIHLGGYLD